jgi:hypothetical protein
VQHLYHTCFIGYTTNRLFAQCPIKMLAQLLETELNSSTWKPSKAISTAAAEEAESCVHVDSCAFAANLLRNAARWVPRNTQPADMGHVYVRSGRTMRSLLMTPVAPSHNSSQCIAFEERHASSATFSSATPSGIVTENIYFPCTADTLTVGLTN